MGTALRPEHSLDQQQGENEEQHDAGDLRGAGKAVCGRARCHRARRLGSLRRRIRPRRYRSASPSAPAQHRRQALAGRAAERLARRSGKRSAQSAAYFEHADRLGDEGRARGDVDVGIEDSAHHEDRAGLGYECQETTSFVRPATRTARASYSARCRNSRATRDRCRRRCKLAPQAAGGGAIGVCCGPGSGT